MAYSFYQRPPLKPGESGGEEHVGKWFGQATYSGHLVGPILGPYDTLENAHAAQERTSNEQVG